MLSSALSCLKADLPEPGGQATVWFCRGSLIPGRSWSPSTLVSETPARLETSRSFGVGTGPGPSHRLHPCGNGYLSSQNHGAEGENGG